MRKYIHNNNGLTLIEILAALVLLSIVLISFFSFFTQSAKFTKYNNDKLSAVQVAESVVAQIRPDNHPQTLTEFHLRPGNLEIYRNEETYRSFIVDIEVSEGPPGLLLASIIVTPKSGLGSQSFGTDMYFEVEK